MAVTQADLARRLGLSVMSVSLALRDSPRISLRTRERVRELAGQLCYRPDPLLAELGRSRWKSVERSWRGTLGLITDSVRSGFSVSSLGDYLAVRAREHHYRIDAFGLDEAPSPERLAEILHTRGIEGVFLYHILDRSFTDRFPWARFTPLTINYSHIDPPGHGVFLERFPTMLGSWAEAVARGYRRIGVMVFNAPWAGDFALNRAAMLYNQQVRFPELPALPWLTVGGSGGSQFVDDVAQTRAWLRAHRPDCVIGLNGYMQALLRATGWKIPGPRGFINFEIGPDDRDQAGYLEDLDAVARAAVDLMDTLLRHGRTGMARQTVRLMLQRPWVEGASLRPRGEAGSGWTIPQAPR